MTGTVPNFFDTAHAQQELQDWDRMAPVGREFGSPDYERLEERDHLVFNMPAQFFLHIFTKLIALCY